MAVRSFGPRAFVSRTIRYNAVRQGLLGGSAAWFSVFVLLRLGRSINKVTKRGEAPIRFSEQLEVGQRLVIEHLPPPERRRRRRS